jgi:hypothetical protein
MGELQKKKREEPMDEKLKKITQQRVDTNQRDAK